MRACLWRSVVILAVWPLVASAADGTAPGALPLPPKAKLRLYLLLGQSNMAGRGLLDEAAGQTHPRILVLDGAGCWALARDPLPHPDDGGRPGVGLGMAFARVVAESDPTITIGLVPCAVGGSPLGRWVKGADLYAKALARARIAMADGTLAGILWHQGESDSGDETLARSYARRLAAMLADLRADLAAPEVPIVVGEMGGFLARRTDCPLFQVVNEQLRQVAADVPRVACASAEGLEDGGDEVHFAAASLRCFGIRYALRMLGLAAPPEPPAATGSP